MYIQYEGFEVTASSRIYGFHVISAPDAACHITVTVQSEAFRPDGLQLQDGPGICFARLDQELQGKAQDSRAEAHLMIGESDIKEYLGLHHSLKKPGKKQEILPDIQTSGAGPKGRFNLEE